jgi:type I restriction enzyme S subunit
MEIAQPKLRFSEFKGKWEEKIFRDLVKINQGLQIQISERYLNQVENSHFYITNEFLKEGSDKKYFIKNPTPNVLCDNDDILMTRTGNTGMVVTNVKGAFHNNFFKISYPKTIDKSFLFYFLTTVKTQNIIKSLAGTSTIPDLNHSDFYKINFIHPSLQEQTKIANFLSDIDEKISLLKEKKSLLQEYKKGIMQKIFNQEIRFKDDNGNDFEDWEEKSLGDVAKFRRGSFPQPYGLPQWYDDENGMPFIQVYDVGSNMLLKDVTKNKISKLGAKQSVFVKKGTLVLTIQGSIGRIAKTQYDAYIDRTLLIFQSYNLPIDIDYFKYVVFLLFEIEKTKAPGGTIKTITKEVLTEFTVPIPCIDEQTKIANFLSSIDEKIELVNTQIQNTQVYKKGLLQQMFV